MSDAMSSIDPAALVDPQLRPFLPLLAAAAATPLTAETLPALRAATPAFLPAPALEPAWQWRTIPGGDEAPPIRVVVIDPGGPAEGLRPAILHFHGGGFVAGSAETSLPRTQALARATGALVVSVEYRLAPETPFPGALVDGNVALAWLHAEAEVLGIDPARIAVMGESAGGGHAATLALHARDRGAYPVAAQALIYPMLDDRTGSSIAVPPTQGAILWTPTRNRFGWGALLGCAPGGDAVPAGAVPARATDLAGLPPTWIGVGGIDLFADEDVAYARRLIAAGVPTRLTVVPGAYHAFDVFDVPIASAFRADLTEWLVAALA